MTPEIISIFMALFIHIPVYFVLFIVIDIKHACGPVVSQQFQRTANNVKFFMNLFLVAEIKAKRKSSARRRFKSRRI